MAEIIGVPTGGGIKDAAMSGGIGAIGAGLVYLSNRFLGNSIWGSLGGIILSGSVLRDGEAKIISTVLGYQLGLSLLGARTSTGEKTSSSDILV